MKTIHELAVQIDKLYGLDSTFEGTRVSTIESLLTEWVTELLRDETELHSHPIIDEPIKNRNILRSDLRTTAGLTEKKGTV